MTSPETFNPFEETEEGKPEENAIDPEKSQFKFTKEDRVRLEKKLLEDMVPDKIRREGLSQEEVDLLVGTKLEEMEEEISRKQNEERGRKEKKLKDEEELQ